MAARVRAHTPLETQQSQNIAARTRARAYNTCSGHMVSYESSAARGATASLCVYVCVRVCVLGVYVFLRLRVCVCAFKRAHFSNCTCF